jgi:acetyltransferase-like isoleucine patch superfamily enzyme
MPFKLQLFIKKTINYFLHKVEVKNNIVLSGFSHGIQNVTFEGKNAVQDRGNFSGSIKIGYATTLGYNNFLHGNITIGKYCQIGSDVAIHTTNHPVNYMSTYINKNLFEGQLASLKEINTVLIGNDVWIGHGVIIVGNITIGNGAILAAGSVITKNVAPYTIVAGIPAKEIKKRFSEQIIKEIEDLKWWDLSENELANIKPLFLKDFTNKNSIYE